MDHEAYIDAIAIYSDRMVAALHDVNPAAPVPSCGEWTVRDLFLHMGAVQRWATDHVESRRERTGPRPPGAEPADEDLGAWLNEGAVALVQALRATPGDTPMGGFGRPADARFWSRRQAHEVAVHAADAQAASGSIEPIDATLASDGLDEYLTEMVPLRYRKQAFELPGSLHVHCTDVTGEWTVRAVDGAYRCDRTHDKGDAALRGPASSALLVLYNRLPVGPPVEVFGDAGVVEWWRANVDM